MPKKFHQQRRYRLVTTGTSRRRNPSEVRDPSAVRIYIHPTLSSKFPRGYGNGFRCPCIDQQAPLDDSSSLSTSTSHCSSNAGAIKGAIAGGVVGGTVGMAWELRHGSSSAVGALALRHQQMDWVEMGALPLTMQRLHVSIYSFFCPNNVMCTTQDPSIEVSEQSVSTSERIAHRFYWPPVGK